MEKNFCRFITLFFVSASMLSAQSSRVVKDFEDPAKETDGFYIARGEAVASLSRIDHSSYGGILEAVVSVQDTGSFTVQIDAFDNGWTDETVGPGFVTVDVFVPEDFPDSSFIQFWQMNETQLQLKSNIYSTSYLNGGRPMIKGAWNTFTFDIHRFAIISEDTYNPANSVSMGLEIQMKNAFTGSIYFDHITLLGACIAHIGNDFEKAGDLYGIEALEPEIITYIKLDTIASGSVLSIVIEADTALNATMTFNDFNNYWIQNVGGPALLVADIYVPSDFPDSSFIQFWEMDKTHWNWQALLYGPTIITVPGWHRTNLIQKGAWNTILFDIRQSYQSNPDFFQPWLLASMGFQFVLNQAWSGTIYMDNLCFIEAAAGLPTEVVMNGNLPSRNDLTQNYPNPFNPETCITYSLTEDTHVLVTITDILGQRIATLVDRQQAAGKHSIRWNGRDQYGRWVPSGVYLYQMKAGSFISKHKMTLIK